MLIYEMIGLEYSAKNAEKMYNALMSRNPNLAAQAAHDAILAVSDITNSSKTRRINRIDGMTEYELAELLKADKSIDFKLPEMPDLPETDALLIETDSSWFGEETIRKCILMIATDHKTQSGQFVLVSYHRRLYIAHHILREDEELLQVIKKDQQTLLTKQQCQIIGTVIQVFYER